MIFPSGAISKGNFIKDKVAIIGSKDRSKEYVRCIDKKMKMVRRRYFFKYGYPK
jgi:hypothetical protein